MRPCKCKVLDYKIKVAIFRFVTKVHVVKVGSITKCLALAAATVALGSGCSGFNATETVSPLMFFLPGLVENKPVPPQIVPIVQTAPPAQIAANRDSAKAN
jgi:hypothetical protein